MYERIDAKVELELVAGRQDNDFQVSWTVEASALVTHNSPTFNNPGEFTVKGFTIDRVVKSMTSYSRKSGWWLDADADGAEENRLEFLNFQLADRDDWKDQIEAAVLEKARNMVGVPKRELAYAE